MITTVSDPVIGFFAISMILFIMYIMHLIWYLIKCNVLGKQRFTSLYFSCGQVLMVVGAGRGPLVRASLQVHFSTCCLIGFGYTMSLDCILHVEITLFNWTFIFLLLLCRLQKKLGASLKFLLWRKIQTQLLHYTWVALLSLASGIAACLPCLSFDSMLGMYELQTMFIW